MTQKIELAGVWRNWATDPPEERHWDTLGRVFIRETNKKCMTYADATKFFPSNGESFEWLDTTPEALQVDNGDGTVTLYGVPVTVPTKLLKAHRVVAVRVPMRGGMFYSQGCSVRKAETTLPGSEVIIEPITPPAPPPSWKPPVSLCDGVYEWTPGRELLLKGCGRDVSGFYRDFTPPPVAGYWCVKDGEAEYLDEKWKDGVE